METRIIIIINISWKLKFTKPELGKFFGVYIVLQFCLTGVWSVNEELMDEWKIIDQRKTQRERQDDGQVAERVDEYKIAGQTVSSLNLIFLDSVILSAHLFSPPLSPPIL